LWDLESVLSAYQLDDFGNVNWSTPKGANK
jgi:hypothetical protein